MPTIDAKAIVQRGHRAFRAGKTRSYEARVKHLKDAQRMIKDHRNDFVEAIRQDLNKSAFETIAYEIMLAEGEIVHFLDDLDEWMKPQKLAKNIMTFGKDAYNIWEPLGLSLIIGAWNYPFQLTIQPLLAAMVAGNTAILKPSELSPATASLLEKIIPRYLDNDCYQVVNGDAVITTALLENKFDHILYTGSGVVGKIVMAAAAKHLTPVTLELGGKSPCYIDADTDLKTAARRAAWGRFVNCGQTCIAPDYIICHAKDNDAIVSELQKAIKKFYGEDPQKHDNYGRIVNQRHWKRITGLIEGQNVVAGGKTDEANLYIEPTIVLNPDINAKCMTDEIFGPVFPIINVSSVDEAIDFINARDKPLALYAFSNNKSVMDRFARETSSGGFVGNDTLIHAGIPAMPFGGVGGSGMGAYHGRFSFEVFSHKKPVLIDKMVWLSEKAIAMRYPPYTEKNKNMLEWALAKSPKSKGYFWPLIKLAFLGVLIAIVAKFFGMDQYLPSALRE